MVKIKFDPILGQLRTEDTISGVFEIKWEINSASDFPTSALVQNWWTYIVKASVTDNDPTKTNTGQSFNYWDVITWNWTDWTDITWVEVFYEDTWASDIKALDSSLPINLQDWWLRDTNVTTTIKLWDASNTTLNTTNKTIAWWINELYNTNLKDDVFVTVWASWADYTSLNTAIDFVYARWWWTIQIIDDIHYYTSASKNVSNIKFTTKSADEVAWAWMLFWNWWVGWWTWYNVTFENFVIRWRPWASWHLLTTNISWHLTFNNCWFLNDWASWPTSLFNLNSQKCRVYLNNTKCESTWTWRNIFINETNSTFYVFNNTELNCVTPLNVYIDTSSKIIKWTATNLYYKSFCEARVTVWTSWADYNNFDDAINVVKSIWWWTIEIITNMTLNCASDKDVTWITFIWRRSWSYKPQITAWTLTWKWYWTNINFKSLTFMWIFASSHLIETRTAWDKLIFDDIVVLWTTWKEFIDWKWIEAYIYVSNWILGWYVPPTIYYVSKNDNKFLIYLYRNSYYVSSVWWVDLVSHDSSSMFYWTATSWISMIDKASRMENDSSVDWDTVKDALETLEDLISTDFVYNIKDLWTWIIYYVTSDWDDINDWLSKINWFATIQKAIDSCSNDDIVFVYPWTYELTTELTCNKDITVIWVYWSENTIIKPTVWTQIRCLYIYETKKAVFRWFTFQDWYTTLAWAWINPWNWGWVCIWQDTGSTPSTDIWSYILDCIIKDCYADQYWWWVYLMDHKSWAVNCIVENCSTATSWFAWGWWIWLRREWYARNCVIYWGAWAYWAWILAHSWICQIHNCIVVDNTWIWIALYNASSPWHQVYNSIAYYNTTNILVISWAYDIRNTDADPIPTWTDNVNIVPDFVDRPNYDYRLNRNTSLKDLWVKLNWQDTFADLQGQRIRYNIALWAYTIDDTDFANTNLKPKTWNYEKSFSSSTTVTVNHNLNKYPSVTILDSSNKEIVWTVTHNSKNQLLVEFTSSTSWIVSCN